jgi:hypothetical protein
MQGSRLCRAPLLVAGVAVLASLAAASATASQAAGTERAAQPGAGKKATVVIGLRRRQAALASMAQGRPTPGSAAYRDYDSVSSLARA